MSKLRTLHVADMHLGFRQYGLKIRENDFYEACERLPEVAAEHDCNVILLAGDNFDTPRPQPEAVTTLQSMVRDANKRGIDVVGIDGNHDSCNHEWLRICGVTPLPDSRALDIRGVRFAGIPSCGSAALEESLIALAKNGGADILSLHLSIAEMADFSKGEFSAPGIAPLLKNAGVKYVALGDIHITRENTFDDIWFAYPGSTEVNAADEPYDKYAFVVEYDTDNHALASTRVPLQSRKFETVTVSSMEDVDKIRGIGGSDSVVVIWWNRDAGKDLRKAVEVTSAPLLGRCAAVRLIHYSENKDGPGVKPFERKGAVDQLKEAVGAYFEPDTPESQLVMQIMGVIGESGAMLPVTKIVTEFLNNAAKSTKN